MPVELPEIEHPPSYSAADVIGKCPFVLLWHGTDDESAYVTCGWLIERTQGDEPTAYVVRDIPVHPEGSLLSYRYGVQEASIREVRILSDQPSVREPGGPARGSAVVG